MRAYRAILPLIRTRLSESLKAVFCGATEQTRVLFDKLESVGADIANTVHQLLPLGIAKLGDSNQKINEAASIFVLWCSDKDQKVSQGDVIQYALTKPASQKSYHIMVAKLNLLRALIEKYGLKHPKLKVPDIMNFVAGCLESKKGEIRQQAVDLLLQVSPHVGPEMEKYLAGCPRMIRDQLEKALGNKESDAVSDAPSMAST
jgi:hypothetical protein